MATTEEILERYPQLGGFIDHPELGSVLRDAADNGWDSQRLQGEIFKTKWYQTNWAAQRQLELLRSTDPAEFKKQAEEAAYSVRSLLAQLGVDATKNKHLIPHLTDQWLKHGKDDWFLYSRLGKELEKFPDLVNGTGQLGARVQEMKEQAAGFLLEYDDATYFRQAVNEWRKLDTSEAIENRMRQEAIRRFKHLEEPLARGLNVRQILQPMTNAVARTLEMNPDQIDLNDARWRQLVEYNDTESGKMRTMTTSEAERWARRQDEFQFTKTARDETYSMATELIRTMGQI